MQTVFQQVREQQDTGPHVFLCGELLTAEYTRKVAINRFLWARAVCCLMAGGVRDKPNFQQSTTLIILVIMHPLKCSSHILETFSYTGTLHLPYPGNLFIHPHPSPPISWKPFHTLSPFTSHFLETFPYTLTLHLPFPGNLSIHLHPSPSISWKFPYPPTLHLPLHGNLHTPSPFTSHFLENFPCTPTLHLPFPGNLSIHLHRPFPRKLSIHPHLFPSISWKLFHAPSPPISWNPFPAPSPFISHFLETFPKLIKELRTAQVIL